MIETTEDTFTEITEGIETPCQFAGRTEGCQDDPARWVMWLAPCCPTSLSHKCVLACDLCKDYRMQPSIALQCRHCGHVSSPASTAYTYIEPLEKKS